MGDEGKIRSGRSRRRLALGALVVLIASVAALQQSWLRVPAAWAPWGPAALGEPPGWLARMQINSLAADPAACFAALDRAGLAFRPVPRRPLQNGCGLVDAVHPLQSRIPYSSGFDASCGLVAALSWYQLRLQDLARRQLGSTITRIDHLGTYACRNINGATQGRRSQHATGNAIDIAGFRLADGRTISILHDWGKPTAEGRFLLAARDEACGLFNVVLSPDYNALHANHFHLDLGHFHQCR